ncbi:MAG TPA: hypothetical protein VKB95_09275 [Chitinophagaceae bacterium]|nr:hypothetical protein [Chitinophagaceae bacterium]
MRRTTQINFLFISFFILFVITNCLGQKGINDSLEYRISQINKECISINNDTTKFSAKTQDVFGYSAEGGELTKYYDGKTLKKAILTLYGERGQTTNEYYFLNGEIILIDKKNEKYVLPIYMGKLETKSKEENKFYFKEQRLIRWIGKDGIILDKFLYRDKEEELLADLKIVQ